MIISDKKYACETCIKGHRSSSCKHFERPLFEIKKKGRPITQCEHCRELRKTKQVHVKCICETKSEVGSQKQGNKSGFDSAAFPNGLPAQAVGTLVALQAPSDSMSSMDAGGCTCNLGGPCHCCTPRKSTRKSKGISDEQNSNASSDDTSVLARIAELRPVLPRPPDLMLLGPHHDPSQGMQHNYARHYDQIYSPYGRAYDAHQHLMQPTSLTMPPYSAGGSSFEQGRMSSISPVEMDTSNSLGVLSTGCGCGEGCQCRGCPRGQPGAHFGRCINPETCSSCINCTLNSLQSFPNDSSLSPSISSAQSQSDSIDEWLRQLTSSAPETGSNLEDAGDLFSNSNPTSFSWNSNLGMLTETNGEYSTINFPSSGDPSSSLRTSRSASHGNSSYSYLDPSLLQNLRFTETPELRPRSHSPTSVLRQPGGIPQASHRVSGRVQSMFSNSTSVRSAAHLNLPASGHFRSHSSSVSPASGQYAVSNPDSDSSRDNGRPTSENRHLY